MTARCGENARERAPSNRVSLRDRRLRSDNKYTIVITAIVPIGISRRFFFLFFLFLLFSLRVGQTES